MALDAVERIVDAEGPEGLSARKVAACIGYTVGTLYLVFDNLDDLVLHANVRTLQRLHERMQAAAAAEAGEETGAECGETDRARRRIATLARTYLEFATEYRGRWGLVFGRRLVGIETLPDWFRERVEAMFRSVEESLAELCPGLDRRQLSLAARALWSGVHGVCVLNLEGSLAAVGSHPVDALLDSLVDNYLAGLRRGCA
jgi:AcrR family transcriptional regulator